MPRVLVVKPSALGDVIHASGPVFALASAGDDVHVTWVVNDEYAEFVRGFPGVADVIPFPRRRFRGRGFPRWVPDAWRWYRDLGRGRFDVAVDLQGLQRSAWMVRASRARERFGWRTARELAWLHYNRRVRPDPAVVHAIGLLELLVERVVTESDVLDAERGIAALEGLGSHRLPVPVDAEKSIDARGDVPSGAIALCPGTRWITKEWPAASWVGLVVLLRERLPDRVLVFLGAPGEAAAIDAIIDAAGGGSATNLAGRVDLWATAAALRRAACAVTMDSAPLHLAAAVGTATVSLFGPTSPRRVAPRTGPHSVLRREELDCLECYERTCPLPARLCLPELAVARVADEVVRRVEEAAP